MNQRIVDFHAHAFHNKIAIKAADNLHEYYGITMAENGLFENLIKSMHKNQITKLVVNASATKPSQVEMTNDFVASVITADIIGFGTLHYAYGNIDAELDRMEKLGLKGIKFHPIFQGFKIDDKKMYPIYEKIEGRFPMLIHVGDKNSDAATPARLANVLTDFPKLVTVAAHLGGYSEWDAAREYLLGDRFPNLYIDTSSSICFLSAEKATELIQIHGADRTLFGSDYPISVAEEEFPFFEKLLLTKQEKERILWKNAYQLLNIEE